MSLDSLLVDMGGFGRFQLLIQISVGFNVMAVGWSMLQMSYAGFIPDWYCTTVDPGHHGNASLLNLEASKEACHVNASWTSFEQVTCQDFLYDTSSITVVTEWNLVCDRKWIKSTITSIQMGGVLLGAFVCGQLADRIGRKKTLYEFALYHCLVNVVAAFAVSWEMFAVCRFMIGIGIGAVLVVQAVYTVEFMPIWWRPFRVLVPSWVIGVSIFAAFTLLLDNWSHLHIAGTLFCLPGLLGYFYLPESIRWLAVQGRLKEAEEVCRKVASINRKEVPANTKSILEKIFQEEQESSHSDGKYTYMDILKGWANLKITLTFSFFWFSMSLIFYGMSFGVSSLAGNLHLNIFLLSIIQAPGQMSAFFLMNKIGRKRTVLLFVSIGFVSAISCVVVHFLGPSDSRDGVITGLSLITQMGIGASWQVIIFWGMELWPTVTRNIGNGFVNTAARVGGVVAPFTLDFDDRVASSYAIIGVLNFVCILLCFVNPDTNGKILQDTMVKKDNPRKEMALNSDKYYDKEKEAGVFTVDDAAPGKLGEKDAKSGQKDENSLYNVRF